MEITVVVKQSNIVKQEYLNIHYRELDLYGLYACVIFNKNSFIDAACMRNEIILQVLISQQDQFGYSSGGKTINYILYLITYSFTQVFHYLD